jgi:hypothetical protein
MQNAENKVNLPSWVSIFNPEITITDEHWAVSFVKHSHESKSEENDHEAEHAFLVIQAHNKLYRREIFHNGNKPGMSIVNIDTRSWATPEAFQEQVNQLIWEDEDTELTPTDTGHLTWSITSEQGNKLLDDIKKDKKNPPKYYLRGNTSVFKPGEREERALRTSLLGGFHLSLCFTGGGTPAGVFSLLASAAALMGVSAFTGEVDEEKNIAHNCATWCVEKLTNLNIPEINKDLTLHFSDKLAYVTGIHVHKDAADKLEAQRILVRQVGKTPCLQTITEVTEKLCLGSTRKLRLAEKVMDAPKAEEVAKPAEAVAATNPEQGAQAPAEPRAEAIVLNVAQGAVQVQGFVQVIIQEAAEVPAAGIGR